VSDDARLRGVFAAVFGVDGDALTDETSPNTVAGWDSVNHLHLVLALEGEFEVQFDPGEIAELSSFGRIRERLARGGHA